MKASIHPQWNHQANVICACGNTFQTGSTKDELRVDICSACHPFYTGSMKFLDVQGRVDRFINQRKAAQDRQSKNQPKSKQEVAKADPKTLKEMLEEEKKKLVTA